MSKIISDTIQGRSKDPNVNAGLTVAGVTTASSDVRISGNINAGIATFTSDVRISGNINAGIATLGAVTVTSITGDGSGLTGVANTDFIVSVAQTTSRLTVNSDANIVGVSTFTGTTTLGQVTLGIGKSINYNNVQKAFISDHAVGVGTTTTTGRNAGLGTAQGTIIFNSDVAQLQVYDGNAWKRAGGDSVSATGGSKDTTTRTGFAVHTFTGSGSLEITAGVGDVEYVIYGGGGGGGGHAAGGGAGAGGVMSGTISELGPGTYTVTVGPGGAGGPTSPVPGGHPTGPGGNSSIAFPSPKGGTIIGYGGAGGAGDPSTGGLPGGSGSGGPGINPTSAGGYGINPTSPSPSLPPALQPLHPYPITQGYDGGAQSAPLYPSRTAGGGGGTGSAGGVKNGGNGTAFSITGASVTKGGGGGGGCHGPGGSAGEGGPGGGADGDGPGPNRQAPSASANTASGGGGGGGTNGVNPSTGGDGGSGIIYVAYPIS